MNAPVAVPRSIDIFDALEWEGVPDAFNVWLAGRREWVANQTGFPHELIDPNLFDGDFTELCAVRDAWEEQHGLELPDVDVWAVPDEPFDPNDI